MPHRYSSVNQIEGDQRTTYPIVESYRECASLVRVVRSSSEIEKIEVESLALVTSARQSNRVALATGTLNNSLAMRVLSRSCTVKGQKRLITWLG